MATQDLMSRVETWDYHSNLGIGGLDKMTKKIANTFTLPKFGIVLSF